MARYYAEKPKELGEVYFPDFPVDRLPAESRNTWNQVWSFGQGVYNRSDEDAIIDYCRLVDLSDRAFDKIQINGFLTEGSKGQLVVSPEFKTYKEIQTMLTTARDRLGLSPRAGAEIGLTKAQLQTQKNKLDGFLNE